MTSTMAYNDDSKLSLSSVSPARVASADTVLAVGRDGGEAVLRVEPLLVLLQRLSDRKDDEGLAVERSQSLGLFEHGAKHGLLVPHVPSHACVGIVGLCSARRDRNRRSVASG